MAEHEQPPHRPQSPHRPQPPRRGPSPAALGSVLIAVLLAIVCAVALVHHPGSHDPYSSANGDSVGPETGESYAQYAARVSPELERVRDEETRFAYVLFVPDTDTAAAAQALQPVPRVDVIIPRGMGPIPIPEPTDDAGRAPVFERALRISGAAGMEEPSAGGPAVLSAAVVYASGSQLRQLLASPTITSIEPAPPGSHWSGFAVRVPDERYER